jgi:hypothetical protein
MRDVCLASGGASPKFEELDLFFRVTLYPIAVQLKPKQPWQESLIKLSHIPLWVLKNLTQKFLFFASFRT